MLPVRREKKDFLRKQLKNDAITIAGFWAKKGV